MYSSSHYFLKTTLYSPVKDSLPTLADDVGCEVVSLVSFLFVQAPCPRCAASSKSGSGKDKKFISSKRKPIIDKLNDVNERVRGDTRNSGIIDSKNRIHPLSLKAKGVYLKEDDKEPTMGGMELLYDEALRLAGYSRQALKQEMIQKMGADNVDDAKVSTYLSKTLWIAKSDKKLDGTISARVRSRSPKTTSQCVQATADGKSFLLEGENELVGMIGKDSSANPGETVDKVLGDSLKTKERMALFEKKSAALE